MSSPNLNNIILGGAILAFMAVIFGGTDGALVSPPAHLVMCKVRLSSEELFMSLICIVNL